MTIGKKVKQLRELKGWSQEHLSSVSGLSSKTIQRIESGKKASLESQQALASAFQIEISEIFYAQTEVAQHPRENRKEYILEIYFEGECIEQQSYFDPIIPPLPGEQFYISFENSNYSQAYGNWWVVEKRKHLKFNESINIETLMLYCVPDPEKGA
ncbi:helix-turn-helix domain-containing protein [Vibrio splendidus]